MKIYKNKDGHITIVYGKGEEPKGVTLVEDRGNQKGNTNIWGNVVQRYAYHWANVHNNSPYTSYTDSIIDKKEDIEYKLVKKTKKENNK